MLKRPILAEKRLGVTADEKIFLSGGLRGRDFKAPGSEKADLRKKKSDWHRTRLYPFCFVHSLTVYCSLTVSLEQTYGKGN